MTDVNYPIPEFMYGVGEHTRDYKIGKAIINYIMPWVFVGALFSASVTSCEHNGKKANISPAPARSQPQGLDSLLNK